MVKRICHCGKMACWGLDKSERCGIHKNVDDINIPINKRIYIFEDVDCISNIVFDRKNKKIFCN